MKNVLYVPLDDRPVNLDDVIEQGKSAGLRLIMPHAADIRNRIDSRGTISGNEIVGTSSPAFGNTENIRRFILDHAASADGFIISVDMLVYGGLIGSRRLRTSGGAPYPRYDDEAIRLLDTIRRVKESYLNKPVFVLDTILRLATSVFVEGVSYEAYVESREFMGRPRREFAEFDHILEGYDLSDTGIPYENTVHFDKNRYYCTRQHKFKTNYYVLDRLLRPGYIDFLAVGVDDAKTQGAQINEIRFVENYIDRNLGGSGGRNPQRAVILPDADGLGHSLVARMASLLHCNGAKPSYAVNYYGPHGSTIINPYEYIDVHENILRHIDIIGGQTFPGPGDAEPSSVGVSAPDIEIIAITAADQASAAVSRIAANGADHRATVVLDFVGQGPADAAVTEALLGSKYTGEILGYSGWNTAGNKIGISLGMGHARYAYLVTETRARALQEAVNAHGSLLFKRFLKDYYYKGVVIREVRSEADRRTAYSNVQAVQSMDMTIYLDLDDYRAILTLLRDRMQTCSDALKAQNAFLNENTGPACNVMRIGGSGWSLAEYTEAFLAYTNPDFIWVRPFEITLSPVVALEGK